MASLTPISGRTMNGSRAVTDSGIASLIHQTAIHQTSPAAGHASSGMPCGTAVSSVNRNPIGPSQKQIRWAVMVPPRHGQGDHPRSGWWRGRRSGRNLER